MCANLKNNGGSSLLDTTISEPENNSYIHTDSIQDEEFLPSHLRNIDDKEE
jgi:hypothetical protein